MSEDGSIPARSRASQPSSRASRCCGSISAASRGEMPKNAASKRSTSSMKPPQRVFIRPGAERSGSKRSAAFQRSAGTSVTA
ncbi:hypothetical protein ASC82_06750 [Streptomyces sp. Root431]|nr:hypothetical protein ASC82_06750 [Streptomyces sp. Root431]